MIGLGALPIWSSALMKGGPAARLSAAVDPRQFDVSLRRLAESVDFRDLRRRHHLPGCGPQLFLPPQLLIPRERFLISLAGGVAARRPFRAAEAGIFLFR